MLSLKILLPTIITILLIAASLGLKIKLNVNTATLSAGADLMFLGIFRVIKIKVFYYKYDFFIKLNNKNYKKIQKSTKIKKNKFKLNFSKPPTLVLRRATVNVNINSSENALTPAFTTLGIQNALANINVLTGGIIRIKRLNSTIFPNYEGEGAKIYIEFRPGFYHFKIFGWFLRTIIAAVLNGKKDRKLNRQHIQ